MTTTIGSSQYSHHTARLSQQFKTTDTNGDSKVDRSEFVTNRPKDLDADKAGQLFDSLDSQKTGSFDETSFISAFQQMGDQTRSALLQNQEVGDRDSSSDSQDDQTERLAKLDTDGDGKISRAEFVSGHPDDVSEDQAGSLYDQIAGDSTDGLTTDQLAKGMRPPMGRHHGESSTADSSSDSQDPGQLLDELLASLQSAQSSTATTPDPSDLFSKLDTDGDGKVSRDEFVAGRPDDTSSSDSSAFYAKVADNNGDSLTQDQFVSGFTSATSDTASNASSTGTASDPNQLLGELIKAIRTYQSAGYQNAATAAASSTTSIAA